MTIVECPSCNKFNEIQRENLPYAVNDEIEHECDHCGQEMTIGWSAKIEVRSVSVESCNLVDNFDYETDHDVGN